MAARANNYQMGNIGTPGMNNYGGNSVMLCSGVREFGDNSMIRRTNNYNQCDDSSEVARNDRFDDNNNEENLCEINAVESVVVTFGRITLS